MPRGRGKAQARRWQAATGTALGLAAIAGVAGVMLAHHQRPPSRAVADSCGLVRCRATLPTPGGPATPAASKGHLRRDRRPRPSPTPQASSPAPPPSASASPSPSASATPPPPSPSATPPQVTVSYVLLRHHHDGQGSQFQGLLTLANLGGTAVSGWTLRLSLPGDAIGWVGPSGGYAPFDAWTYTSGTLTMTAADDAETLAPGGTEEIMIWGQGPGAWSGCAFDGNTCG